MLPTRSDRSEASLKSRSQEDEGTLIRNGYEAFLDKRFPDSVAYFTRAARFGSPQADYWLGYLTLDHGCAEQGLSGGEAALARAADAGHGAAATRLAAELLKRKDDEAALTEAVERLQAAVGADEPMAHYLLANCLRWGIGLPADPPQASRHLRIAVDAGVEGAAEALAELERASSEAPSTQRQWMERGPEDALARSPRAMTLEITTRCNLTCVMCPHGLEDGMLVKRDAPDVMIEAVLRSLDDLDEIHPTGVGEPLLAEGFWRIVDTLKGRTSPKLVFHTNGMLLTERNVERLNTAPIARVNISVDAADPMTYRRIRGAEMRKTLDGIRRLVQASSFAGETPPVCLSMVLMRENIEEAPQFVRMAAELGIRHVYFEHLTEPHVARETWKVSRGNFNFNYAEQDLHDEPDYADKHIILAMDEADRLGIVIEGYEVLLSPENASHQQRRCRTGAFAPSSI